MVPNKGSGRPLNKVVFHTTKPSDIANISLDSADGNLCFPATAGAPIRYSAKCRLPTRFQEPRVCVCVCGPIQSANDTQVNSNVLNKNLLCEAVFPN